MGVSAAVEKSEGGRPLSIHELSKVGFLKGVGIIKVGRVVVSVLNHSFPYFPYFSYFLHLMSALIESLVAYSDDL